MTDRRRTPRYVLATPLLGVAAPMQDVTVEECSGGRAVVISPSAHRHGDEMTLHITTADGLASHPARVVSSSPTSVGGALCFRIELSISGGRSSRGEGDVVEDSA